MKYLGFLALTLLILASCSKNKNVASEHEKSNTDTLRYPEEKHFKNVKKLTFGGDNAEAYWSFDDTKLIFQATNPAWNAECDQIYITDWKNDNLKINKPLLVSTGYGRTTCSYFLPGDSLFLFASTHEYDKLCPPKPDERADHKYVWAIYEGFDIFVSRFDGTVVKKLTDTKGYDAEATVSPKGDKIVFTSLRNGDLDLYTMNIDGSDVKQITFGLGYDGGAFFSPDGNKIVFRASRPKTDKEIKEYKDFLKEGLVMPTNMEIYTCNTDGSNLKQITNLGKANWSPFFHPSGKKIIFSSNHASDKGFSFNLYMINIDGTGLERITFDKTFDAFPVFSNDGKKIVFSSNRFNAGTYETNLFLADWVD